PLAALVQRFLAESLVHDGVQRVEVVRREWTDDQPLGLQGEGFGRLGHGASPWGPRSTVSRRIVPTTASGSFSSLVNRTQPLPQSSGASSARCFSTRSVSRYRLM